MAKKRDVIIALIIGGAFVVTFGFFGLMVIGIMSGGPGYDFSGSGGNIGVVEMFGVIDEGSGRPVIRQLEKWGESNSIKGIVVHVNSPGGGVAISQEIYDAILRVRDEDKKPVVVSMASVAASGGYYIACAADRIVANPGTVTGSIGVIFQYHTAKGLLDKFGIKTETVKSGELKDVGSYSKNATEKERLMLRSVVMDTYEQFVGVVAEGRGKEREEIYPLADGSIYTGLQAQNLGLVDELGGLKEAVQLAADLADITDPKIVRPYKRDKIGLFDLLNGLVGSVTAKVENSMAGPRLMYLCQF